MSVDKLVKQFGRTKTTIYRIINEVRAARIMELPLDFIPNPRFARKGAEAACLGPMPESDTPARKVRRPTGLPPYLASLYEMPLLTREQEQHVFRKYNFLKYKAAKLRDGARSGPAAIRADGRDRIAVSASDRDQERDRASESAAWWCRLPSGT